MKNTKLISAIEAQAAQKEDFIADLSKVSDIGYNSELGRIDMEVGGQVVFFSPEHHYLLSLAANMNLPKETIQTMLQFSPKEILEAIRNSMKEVGRNRVLRTLNGEVRGVVSPRYARINHEQLIPFINGVDLEVKSFHLDDTSLSVRMTGLECDKKSLSVGEEFSCGVLIMNDETGHYRFQVRPFIERLICSNGAVSSSALDTTVDLRHIQSRPELLFENSTIRRLELPEAIMLNGSEIDLSKIKTSLDSTIEAIKYRIDNNRELSLEQVKKVLKELKLNQTESGIVIERFEDAPDSESGTEWAFINGITSLARDTKSNDRRIQLETIGFNLYHTGVAVAA